MEQEERKKERKKQYNKGLRRDLVGWCLSLGCVTTRGMKIYYGKDYAKKHMYVKTLINEDIIKEGRFKYEGLMTRYYTLNDYNNLYLRYIGSYPAGTHFVYMDYEEPQARFIGRTTKEEMYQRERAARISDTAMMFHTAGVPCMAEDKEEVLSGEKLVEKNLLYLTSNEIKKSQNIKNTSRAVGYYFGIGETYVVYHTGQKRRLKWSLTVEGKNVNCINLINSTMRKDSLKHVTEVKAILTGGEEAVLKLFEQTEKRKKRSINNAGMMTLPCGHKKLYYVPYNEFGCKMINIIGRNEWEKELKKEYLSKYSPAKLQNGIAHDARDGDTNIILFCIPDLESLHNFILHARYADNKNRFRIICFEEQKAFIQEVAEDSCEIETVNLDEYMEKKGIVWKN